MCPLQRTCWAIFTSPRPHPARDKPRRASSTTRALCGSKVTQLVDPMTGAIVPGNVYAYTPGLESAIAEASAYLPPIKPLPDGTDACGHVQYVIPNQNFDKQFITRMDYTINSTNHLYGRYMLDSYQLPAYFYPTNIPGDHLLWKPAGESTDRHHRGGPYLHQQPRELRSRRSAAPPQSSAAITPPPSIACDLSVNMLCGVSTGLYLGTGSGANLGSFSMGGSTNAVSHFNDNTLVIDDDVTWVHGRHLFFFGGEFVRNQLNISNAFNSNGAFSFGSNYSSYGPYGSKNQAADNPEYGPAYQPPRSGAPRLPRRSHERLHPDQATAKRTSYHNSRPLYSGHLSTPPSD